MFSPKYHWQPIYADLSMMDVDQNHNPKNVPSKRIECYTRTCWSNIDKEQLYNFVECSICHSLVKVLTESRFTLPTRDKFQWNDPPFSPFHAYGYTPSSKYFRSFQPNVAINSDKDFTLSSFRSSSLSSSGFSTYLFQTGFVSKIFRNL